MVNIRQAKIEDTEKIVDININSWISTYKDIVPKDVIEKRKTNRNEIINRWKKKIEEDQSFYVIEDNQEIFGFVSFGNSYNEKYKDYGEIYSLYLKDNFLHSIFPFISFISLIPNFSFGYFVLFIISNTLSVATKNSVKYSLIVV